MEEAFPRLPISAWSEGLWLMLRLNTLPLILGVMLAGDALVFRLRPAGFPDHIWALLDSPVHAALALLVVSPLICRRDTPTRRFSRLASALLAAVLIDLDHFAAAGSFSLYAATHLPGGRPVTHSLLFALLCGLLAWRLTRDAAGGWLIFGVLASHFLRDASSGSTPLLFPFPFERLPLAACYLSQVGLFLFLGRLADRLPYPRLPDPGPHPRPALLSGRITRRG